MRDVVAEIGQQHGLCGTNGNDFAERVFARLDRTQLDSVRDDFGRCLVRVADALGKPAVPQHVQVEQQLLLQFHPIHRQLARGKQDRGQQIDRIDVGGLVNAGHDAVAEAGDQWVEPDRALLGAEGLAAPVG